MNKDYLFAVVISDEHAKAYKTTEVTITRAGARDDAHLASIAKAPVRFLFASVISTSSFFGHR